MAGGDPRRRLGSAGEELAAQHLTAQGYQVLTRGFRCRAGEIDVVARHGRQWVFCEVKTRCGRTCGSPAEQLRPRQQERVRQAAAFFLQQQGLNVNECEIRFDLIAVWEVDGKVEIEQLVGAF